jgi:hypothetical protein
MLLLLLVRGLVGKLTILALSAVYLKCLELPKGAGQPRKNRSALSSQVLIGSCGNISVAGIHAL